MVITEELIWYPIYADTNEIQKSTLLTELYELEEEEYDEYGKKKRKGSNLKNLEISEISLCQSGKVGVKYLIQKGDEKKVANEYENLQEAVEAFIEEPVEEEFFEIEKRLSETNRNALVKAVNILNKYKKEIAENPELKTSLLTLARFVGSGVGYPSSVKKDLAKSEPVLFNWRTFIENAEENIEEEEGLEGDIEKSDTDKFPSLTRGLLKGQRRREKAQIERNLDSGRRFV